MEFLEILIFLSILSLEEEVNLLGWKRKERHRQVGRRGRKKRNVLTISRLIYRRAKGGGRKRGKARVRDQAVSLFFLRASGCVFVYTREYLYNEICD